MDPLGVPRWLLQHPKTTLALGAYTIPEIRNFADSGNWQHNARDLMARRRQDLSTPMTDLTKHDEPQLTVTASYDLFALAKTAVEGGFDPRTALANGIGTGFQGGIGAGIGNTVADLFIKKPYNAIADVLQKTFVTRPRQARIFNQVVDEDPELSGQRDLASSVHGTIKKFAPTLSEDPNALRSYLRQAVALGGAVDPMTIKALSEAEKTYQQSRGKAVGP